MDQTVFVTSWYTANNNKDREVCERCFVIACCNYPKFSSGLDKTFLRNEEKRYFSYFSMKTWRHSHSSRLGTSVNQKILLFFICLHKNVCTHSKLLVSTHHNIVFYGEIRNKNSPKTPHLPGDMVRNISPKSSNEYPTMYIFKEIWEKIFIWTPNTSTLVLLNPDFPCLWKL